jgi:parallel beta-helix repeat protein
MLKTISLKKKLNDSLLSNKIIENHYGVILHTSKSSETIKNKVSFTKLALKNKYLKKVFAKSTFHFPLTFIFFKEYNNVINFLKTNINQVIMLKLKNKMIKKKIINMAFLSKNYFEKLNFNYLFLSY